MNRLKAATIHFSASLLVAAIATGLLLGLWYPPPYFQAGGADRLLLLVVGVDVILGPLLTLIVFDTRKHELKRDLTIIVLLQVAALVYGFHVMLLSRPVFLVAAVDRYIVVSANQLEPADLVEAPVAEWRRLSWTGPVLVAAERPEAPEARNQLLFSALAGKDIELLPRFYVPFEHQSSQLLERGRPLTTLRSINPDRAHRLDAWLERNQRSESSIVWFPIVARMRDITMLADSETGQPLAAIDMAPW